MATAPWSISTLLLAMLGALVLIVLVPLSLFSDDPLRTLVEPWPWLLVILVWILVLHIAERRGRLPMRRPDPRLQRKLSVLVGVVAVLAVGSVTGLVLLQGISARSLLLFLPLLLIGLWCVVVYLLVKKTRVERRQR